jgi:uncharacterized protein YciI
MDISQNKNQHFIFFYFNRNEPEKIRQVVAAHVGYWKAANLKEYLGGPFADRTGGLIFFAASSLEEATEIILQDHYSGGSDC